MKKVILFILMLSLLMTGCRDPLGQEPEASPEAEEAEPAGDALSEIHPAARVQDQQEMTETQITLCMPKPDSLLPWMISNSYEADLLSLICEPLWVPGSDGKPDLVLAESYELSEDGTYLDVALKKNILFHDGSGLDAGDVYETMRSIRSMGGWYRGALESVEGMTVVDFYTIRIYLKNPGFYALEELIFPVVPEETGTAAYPAGTGPYLFSEDSDRRQMRLSAFEDYHGKVPEIPGIRVIYTQDAKSVKQAFDSGRSDLFHMDNMPWDEYQFNANYQIDTCPGSSLVYLEFSTAGFGSVLSNRQKTAWAIDSERVLREAALGYGYVCETPIRTDYWYGKRIPETYPYDPERAAMVAVSGENVQTVRLMYDASDPVLTRAAAAVADCLKECGMDATLVTFGDYDLRVVRRDVHLLQGVRMIGAEEALSEALTEEEVVRVLTGKAMESLEQLPVYGLFFLDDGAVRNNKSLGNLNPGEVFIYRGIENIR